VDVFYFAGNLAKLIVDSNGKRKLFSFRWKQQRKWRRFFQCSEDATSVMRRATGSWSTGREVRSQSAGPLHYLQTYLYIQYK